MQDVGKHLLGGGKAAVGYNAFYLGRQREGTGHQHRSPAHGSAVQKDAAVFAFLLHGPLDPCQGVPAVQTAKPDIFAFAFAVGPLIHQKHGKPVFEIVVRQADVIAHSFAGIAMEADHDFFAFVVGKKSPVKLQPVIRSDPDVPVGLGQHPLLSFFDQREILGPVGSRHFYGAVRPGIPTHHGPPVEIGGDPGFRSGKGAQSGCGIS